VRKLRPSDVRQEAPQPEWVAAIPEDDRDSAKHLWAQCESVLVDTSRHAGEHQAARQTLVALDRRFPAVGQAARVRAQARVGRTRGYGAGFATDPRGNVPPEFAPTHHSVEMLTLLAGWTKILLRIIFFPFPQLYRHFRGTATKPISGDVPDDPDPQECPF
jgi:hypothetical protein